MITIKIKRHIKRDPKRETINFVIILLFLMVVFGYAVNYFVSRAENLSKSAETQIDKLLFTMRMKETSYAMGDPIELRIEVRNITLEPVRVVFPEKPEFDFLIQKEVNLIFTQIPMSVWRYTAVVGLKEDEHEVTLEPQQALTFKAIWDQKDFRGKQVKPGTYIITGSINTQEQNAELQMRGKMGPSSNQ